MIQPELFPEERIVPTTVLAALAPSERVRVVDGFYHLYAGNEHKTDKRTGKERVVGTRMRCGLVKLHTPTWNWPGVLVAEAHKNADPCSRCFP